MILVHRLILSHCCPLYLQPISSPLSHGPSYPVTPPNKPQDLATALLILEGDKYTRILPADYISYLQHQPPKGNVEAAFQMNHRIINWVKYGVLNYDKLEDRIEVLKFLVFTAEVMSPVDTVDIICTDYGYRNLVNCVISHPCQRL